MVDGKRYSKLYNFGGFKTEEVERLERMPGLKTTQYHYNQKK